MQTKEKLFIGIDGGGSKCRAILSNAEGKVIGRGMGGAANPFHGVQRAIDSIVEASYEAIENAGYQKEQLKSVIAGIGLAGVNLPDLYQKLNYWEHPFLEMYLTTDMEIANIGAHGESQGAVIIIGTGSVGFINFSGEQSMLGGYGFPISDKASGAWMGLKAIEHTLLVLDAFEHPSLLAEKISQFYSIKSGLELSQKLIGHASSEYAKVASIIFDSADQGDESALKIISEGASYISALARRLVGDKTIRLSLVGGLARYWLPRLDSRTSDYFSKMKQEPEFGALHFAMQSWKNNHRKTA